MKSLYLCVVAQVKISALWMEGTSATSIHMSLVEGLEQPHKVGTVRLEIKQHNVEFTCYLFCYMFNFL